MNPQCPICGNYLVFIGPPYWMANPDLWNTLLLVRHIIKHHADWIELAD